MTERKLLSIKLSSYNCRLIRIAMQFGEDGDTLCNNIEHNTWRYISIFSDAVDELLPTPTAFGVVDDVFDVMLRQRMQDIMRNNNDNPEAAQDRQQCLPKELTRR